MTRGYVCITGKGTHKVAYLISDAYLSSYGLQILEAKKNDRLVQLIDEIAKDNDPDDCKGFQLNWIRPDKESRADKNWRYAEYGYIFNVQSFTISVYHYGKRLFVINCKHQKEMEKYLFLFEHEDDIYHSMAYNESLLKDTITFDQAMKQVKGNSLSVLESLVQKANAVNRVYLSDEHLIARGYRADRPSYIKELTDTNSGYSLKFIASQDYDKKWSLLLQTPFVRIELDRGLRSERAVVKRILQRIHNQGSEKFLRLAEIMSMCRKACEKKDMLKIQKLKEDMEAMFAEQEWFTYNSQLTPRWFTNELRRSARHM